MIQEPEQSSTEKRLWHCVNFGEPLDLRTGVAEDDDVAHARARPEERCIRGDFLAFLLLRVEDGTRTHIPVLRLRGARITGPLVLTGADIGKTLVLEQCFLEEAPELSDARTRSIQIIRSSLPGLDARHVNVDGQLDLTGTVVTGRMGLVNAHVTGELIMNGCVLNNPEDWTFFAGGIIVDGGFFARHGFESQGGIRLVGARLNGGLFLDHVLLTATAGGALVADNLKVEGRIICDGLVAHGEVRLPGARINGQLSWNSAIIRATDTGLDCRRLVAEELILTPAEPIKGIVDLGNARVSVFVR